ncbi:hypothetical protein ACQCSX_22485 (plasmid) [Pseudarthrobacter sp. P1]|uniref:hypothetical protein n=1 Tax=Pseudarthrobacter sp. P1 TaxID=3418418 RepID=UPI003CF5B7DE
MSKPRIKAAVTVPGTDRHANPLTESLAATVPQVSRRARAYNLEDDGASDLSRRKRAAKDSAANRRQFIAAIEQRQAGQGPFPPRDPEVAARLIDAHRQVIRAHETQRDAASPAANIIAPVARRVAREDRRRKNKTPDGGRQ